MIHGGYEPGVAEGWTIWQRGDSDERKRDVWQQHKQTGLSDTLTALIQLTGPPEAVAIRRLK